jgi:hypothetical protein
MCSNAFGKIRGLANIKTKVESASYVGDEVKVPTLGIPEIFVGGLIALNLT